MELNLKGKKALVCGSSQGIGLAAAQELAILGAEVTLFARNADSLDEAKQSLTNEAGQNHSILVADFFDNDSVRNAVADTNDFHILVNNTGGPQGGKAIDADVSEFERAFSSHLINNQIITTALVPFMKSACYGRVINIISTSVKAPIPGLGVSNTIRGAVNSWSKTLSNELGSYGITVNNVLPGATDTARLQSIISSKAQKLDVSEEIIVEEMRKEIPMNRFADSSEIGSVVAFLATPAAGYVNGVNIPVDGGRTNCF